MVKRTSSDQEFQIDDSGHFSQHSSFIKPIKKNPKNTSHEHKHKSEQIHKHQKKTQTKPKPNQRLIENQRHIYEDSDLIIEDIQLRNNSEPRSRSQSLNQQQQQAQYISSDNQQESQNKNPQNNNNQIIYNNNSNSGENQNADDIEDLRMMLVEFFNSIDQPNGLVFKKDLRAKLNKLYSKKLNIRFDPEHDLDPEGEQIGKIRPQVQKIHIFFKNHHRYNRSDEQFVDYIFEDKEKMIEVFKESSYIFCRQVTHELYSILRRLCNIVLKHIKNEQDGMKLIKQELREFGDKVAAHNEKEYQYFFFGFQFITLPAGKTADELAILEVKDKFKFALKSRFRQPNTEYATFMEKAGLHLMEHLRELSCFSTFKGVKK